MASNRAANTYRSSYVYGNTVRKNVQVLSDPRRDLEYKAQEQERRERHRRNAQAERMSFLYVTFLAVAAVMLVFICYQFLTMQTTMSKNVTEISSLKVQLEDMKAENDFLLGRIKDSVDLNEIRRFAINELGMVEANPSQIIGYAYDSSDYLRQYANVPDAEESSVLEYFSE